MTETEPDSLRLVFGGEDPLAALRAAREEQVRLRAYFKAEKRGFAPGRALDDWLAAEQEYDAEHRPR